MSNKIPAISEFEKLAIITQEDADTRHGDRYTRDRRRRIKRVTNKALAYTIGGSIAIFGGGYLLDKGLDQIDRFSNPNAAGLSAGNIGNETSDVPADVSTDAETSDTTKN
jgi:hypothetical protein